MPKKVVILGGGVAGLTAAHELIERGYTVEVCERRDPVGLGGRARTQWFNPQKNIPGWPDGKTLPGEHGFRFFPRFYRHVIDTMARTPFYKTGRMVVDNLLPSEEAAFARRSGGLVIFPKSLPQDPLSLFQSLHRFVRAQGMTNTDVARFTLKLLQFATSCESRRLREYEQETFWRFIKGDHYSPEFQRYLEATPRTLVAMNTRQSNAKTIGTILLQFLMDISTRDESDRVLNGPTSERWLIPWVKYLMARGVKFTCDREALTIAVSGDRVQKITTRSTVFDAPPDLQELTADYFIVAVHFRAAQQLIMSYVLGPERQAQLKALDPTEGISGIQYYLPRYVGRPHGHVYYPGSDRAVTSVFQAQFWGGAPRFAENYGHGVIGDILSVIVADWGTRLSRAGYPQGRQPRQLPFRSLKELAEGVWRETKEAINGDGAKILTSCLAAHVDDDIERFQRKNAPELPATFVPPVHVIHPPGFWRLRPDVKTGIKNMFLAGDYVRSTTDLATMEAANETARRAVNALLEEDGDSASPCRLFPLREPEALRPLRELDAQRFAAKDPHLFDSLELTDLLPEDGASGHDLREYGEYARVRLDRSKAHTGLENLPILKIR